MASELLFDISSLDLSAQVFTFQQVGRLIPQTGHMRQLDHVIWANEDYSAGLGVKIVRDDEFWVPGHIPGRPLLPGVLMIETAAQLGSVLFQCRQTEPRFMGFTRCDNVVFRGQVVPGDTMYLLAKQIDYRPRRFISATQAVLNGKIVFEATITGMVI